MELSKGFHSKRGPKTGPDGHGRTDTDGRTDAQTNTHRFFGGSYTISPSGKNFEGNSELEVYTYNNECFLPEGLIV